MLFFILQLTNLLLFHFSSKKQERTVISGADLVGGGGVGIGLGLGLGLGKTFNAKFHKNCENTTFIITILILQFFLLHMLTVGVTFQSDPCNWDLHLDNILSKASSRLYILSVCKFYGLPLDHLHLLFTSLILPIFTYAVEVWGCAYYHKYLSCIGRLLVS